VEYSRWAPRYARIASELGYDLARERSAAEALAALLPTEARDSPFQRCRARITGRTAIVVGLAPGAGAPPLHLLRGSASPSVVLAADGAAAPCLASGIVPDLVVTDLDGPVPSEIAANARGSLVVVHAHADNREPVARWVPEFTGALAGSWAGPPTESLLDVGGFTDGDRAAYLAEAGGARSILLWGFAFDRAEERDPVERTRKLRKLAFARDAIGFLAASSSVPLEEWRPDGSRRPIQGGAAERSTQ
jgi:2-amino-4-hydroxy-6-hydroxymethyldihydropteridine diphosphokinase